MFQTTVTHVTLVTRADSWRSDTLSDGLREAADWHKKVTEQYGSPLVSGTQVNAAR